MEECSLDLVSYLGQLDRLVFWMGWGCFVFPVDETRFLGKVKAIIFVTLEKVSKGAKIRNRYNQVPHLTQDTNEKVTNSQQTPQTRAKRSALSQQVTTKQI